MQHPRPVKPLLLPGVLPHEAVCINESLVPVVPLRTVPVAVPYKAPEAPEATPLSVASSYSSATSGTSMATSPVAPSIASMSRMEQRLLQWQAEYTEAFDFLYEQICKARNDGHSQVRLNLYKVSTLGSSYEREWRNRLSCHVFDAIFDFMQWAQEQGYAVTLVDKWRGTQRFHALHGESWGELTVSFGGSAA